VDWTEEVYKPDILNGAGMLYKKPGYHPYEDRRNVGVSVGPASRTFGRGGDRRVA
jgi:hypothetical protein